MQMFLACSILTAVAAQDCDICEGRAIPDGRTTYDGHDCVETIPFCQENLMICGGECAAVKYLVGGACCPVEEGPCDICQGRPILDHVMESGYTCAESIPFCNDFAGQCYGTCTELSERMGPECCPADGSEAPPDGSEAPTDGSAAGSCDICQGREISEGATFDGNDCAPMIQFCEGNLADCGGDCAGLQAAVGVACCPAPGACDVCQGNEIIDFTLETGYSCMDSVPFCVDNPAACGGTCEEVQAALGATCCPSAAQAAAAAETSTTQAPAPTPAPPVPAAPAPAPVSAPAAEDEEGDDWNSGAVTGATAKLTMFLVVTVIGLLC